MTWRFTNYHQQPSSWFRENILVCRSCQLNNWPSAWTSSSVNYKSATQQASGGSKLHLYIFIGRLIFSFCLSTIYKKVSCRSAIIKILGYVYFSTMIYWNTGFCVLIVSRTFIFRSDDIDLQKSKLFLNSSNQINIQILPVSQRMSCNKQKGVSRPSY